MDISDLTQEQQDTINNMSKSETVVVAPEVVDMYLFTGSMSEIKALADSYIEKYGESAEFDIEQTGYEDFEVNIFYKRMETDEEFNHRKKMAISSSRRLNTIHQKNESRAKLRLQNRVEKIQEQIEQQQKALEEAQKKLEDY